MWLVGTLTQGRTERRLRDLSLLSDQLLDLIAGLPTLRSVERQGDTVQEVNRLSARHTDSTMGVLRIAFLSSFVLEFLATLSVALMAVGIGFRLLDGSMTLAAGLTVLVIAPDVYSPIREVGTRFHDAQDGLAATDRILALLAAEPPAPCRQKEQKKVIPGAHAPAATGIVVEFDRLSVAGRDGLTPHDLSATARPGELTVLAGPNGSGKSTALLALLGIVTDGVEGHAAVTAHGRELSGTDLWAQTAYLPQRPVLDPTSIGDFAELSLGQRQRVAMRRELARDRWLIVCDEPTAHLDQERAQDLIDELRAQAHAGKTVLIASHDPLVLAAADNVVEVSR